MRKKDLSLKSLTNIGPVTIKKLNKIGIYTREDFLTRDPFEVFAELIEKVEPELCRCALASIVGAKLNVKWHEVTHAAAKEFEKRYPNHTWKNKC